MQATCSSCANVVTVDENNPKLPAGPFSVKCPKCQTPVRFPGRPAKAAAPPAAPAASPAPAREPAASAAPRASIPLKPTALPGERALVALDDQQRAGEMARSLELLGYEVDIMSDTDGVRAIEQALFYQTLREDLIARGRRRLADFDWNRTARAYRAVYRKASGQRLSAEDAQLLQWDWMRNAARSA